MTRGASDLAGFTPETGAGLEAAIGRHGRGGAAYDAARPPLAVFDWDNTCIYNDIGDAAFEHALATLDVRFGDADLTALVPERLGWRARREPVLTALAAAQGGSKEAANDFRAELLALYEDMQRTDGSVTRYKWVAAMLAGRTEAELEALADAAIEKGLGEPLGSEQVTSRDRLADVTIARGLRIYRPMAALIARLLDAGWDVRVISASAEPLVRAFGRRIGLAPERVLGVRLEKDGSAGRLAPRVLEPFTYAEGKVAAIDRFLGRRPKLVAGDSPGDLPMLRASEDVRLVVTRSSASEPAKVARKQGWLVAKSADLLAAS
jgi:phosphoserine phosphatase